MKIKVGDHVRIIRYGPQFEGVEGIVRDIENRVAYGVVTKLNGNPECFYKQERELFRIPLCSLEVVPFFIDDEDIWE